MSSNQTNAAVLAYWRAIELFSPQNIPKPTSSDEPVYSIVEDGPLPWSTEHQLKKKRIPKDKIWRFQIYCGVFKLEKVKKLLDEKFGQDPESFDTRPDGETCLCSFSITDDGRPLFDSFVLSTCAWAVARTQNPGPVSKVWLDGFESSQSDILNKFSDSYSVLQDDALGQGVKEKGFNVGRPLQYRDILKEIQLLVKELGGDILFDSGKFEFRIKATIVPSKYRYSTDDQDFLNSFFIKDLGKVAVEIKKGNVGKGLATYLAADEQLRLSERIDTRRSINALFQQLSPSLFPIGRWPSKGHHPLAFSQQFAVNSAVQQLANSAGIFSVNGPPGTGKTTLLRDLIASIVVERARKLSALDSPSDAFSGERRWKSGDYTRVISLWKDQFKGFEIVVASYNNGAVENISLEIPGIEAIDSSWLPDVDYFPDIAAMLSEQRAWSMVSARLGNRTNRNSFITQFWGKTKTKKTTGDDKAINKGILDFDNRMLARLHEFASQHIDWEKAVTSFKAALADEKKIRDERIAFYNSCLEFISLQKELPLLVKKFSELEAEYNDATLELQDAVSRADQLRSLVDRANQDRLDNRRFRPGLIEIIFSLGKRFKEWDREDGRLQNAVEIAKHNLSNGLKRKLEFQQRAKSAADEFERASAAIRQKRQRQEDVLSNLNDAKKKLGVAFPAYWTWETDEDGRELSSPWSDPEWNGARAKVFLAAIALHKAFLIANAEVMRKNLQAAMDVLSGAVPETAPPDAVESAWTSLFLVIPVISTTFASFDRLFSHLGRESLGWLLIDEAGQAAPQTAAGAIWRSRRSIVVGDPLQLEPVVTIPFTVQQALRRHFGVAETWLPGRTSVQQLADRVNKFGTCLNGDDEPLWVGSPLRVHRRCDRQMFEISNTIAYEGMMVFGTSTREPIDLPESTWIDVDSQDSEGHWIPAEGREVVGLISELLEFGIPENEIFLISPFKDVVGQLRKIAGRFGGEIKVGTMHTVQGKESEVVILVLGGNPSKPGAKQWASEKPNLLNVAASRAKRRLYVVGNRDEWKKCKYFSVCAASIGNRLDTNHNG